MSKNNYFFLQKWYWKNRQKLRNCQSHSTFWPEKTHKSNIKKNPLQKDCIIFSMIITTISAKFNNGNQNYQNLQNVY